jgi:hypothetical protein
MITKIFFLKGTLINGGTLKFQFILPTSKKNLKFKLEQVQKKYNWNNLWTVPNKKNKTSRASWSSFYIQFLLEFPIFFKTMWFLKINCKISLNSVTLKKILIFLIIFSVPKPVFQTSRKTLNYIKSHQQQQQQQTEVLSPQHEELVKYMYECKWFRFILIIYLIHLLCRVASNLIRRKWYFYVCYQLIKKSCFSLENVYNSCAVRF